MERERIERAKKEQKRLTKLGILEQEQIKLLQKESRMKE
jgi:Fe2+ transport system protein FeoA